MPKKYFVRESKIDYKIGIDVDEIFDPESSDNPFTFFICPICCEKSRNIGFWMPKFNDEDLLDNWIDNMSVENDVDDGELNYIIHCNKCKSMFLLDINEIDDKSIKLMKLKPFKI